MPSARSYHCPTCGGEVDEQARSCGYCGSPIATVRCAGCFHMNVPSALHCSGCGRELGLEPVGDPSKLRCPECNLDLASFRAGPGTLGDCGRCGGQFVEHALLRDLLEQREIFGRAAPRRVQPQNPMSQRVRYVHCPSCGELMNRKNFGGSSGVVVDVCYRHGTWFDAGELPMVMAFVESGGLARARRREGERLARENQERVSARAAVESGRFHGHEIVGDPSLLVEIGDAALTLLSLAVDAIKH